MTTKSAASAQAKNICPICRHNQVANGHLCAECFSTKLVDFDGVKNVRNVKIPVFASPEYSYNEYTHSGSKEFLPIPELVEEPLVEHAIDVDEETQSETSLLIADIEQTLMQISTDDSPVKISSSKARKKINTEKPANKVLKIPTKREFPRTSLLLKKNGKKARNLWEEKKHDADRSKNKDESKENTSHELKLQKKKTEYSESLHETSTLELKKLSRINIKKQLRELETAMLNFDIENKDSASVEHSENAKKLEYSEIVENENTEKHQEIEEKWEQIKDLKVSAVRVEKRIEKNYRKNKLPLKLAEYEQAISMLLGAKNLYELPVSWRLHARFKAFNDAHIILTKDQVNKIRHITLLESKNEKYLKDRKGFIGNELIQSGNWKWFTLTSIVHSVFLIALWSVILVEAQPVEPKKMTYFDPSMLAKDIDNSAMDLQPDLEDDPDDPMNRETDYDPEFANPEDVPMPEIPGINFNPTALDSKEDRKVESDRPSIVDTHNLGVSVSSKGGEKDGEEGINSTISGHRRGTGKETMLAKHGGTKKTVNSVKLGLKWLAEQQKLNGSWRAEDAPATGNAHVEGYTGLALLCFLGDGHTENFGEYKETIRKAVQFLLNRQSSSSGVFSSTVGGMLYNHSIVTLALSEYYTLTGREDLLEPLKRALKFLYNSQQASGGWDYTSNKLQNRTDMSITGWVMMALHSAMSSGIPVRRSSWESAYRGVQELLNSDGSAYYSVNGSVYPFRKGIAMTAVSVLCRLYARVPVSDRLMEKSIRWMKTNLPNKSKLRSSKSMWGKEEYRKLKNNDDFFHTTYYWYYGTLSLFMITNGVGKDWNRWNKALQQAILSYQITKDGDFQGSWDPLEDFWGEIGGRLYSTCLNILNLEIYYRYLPLYDMKEHTLRFENKTSESEKTDNKPDDEIGTGLIKSVSEASRIINDPTKSDSDKIIAITYLKIHRSDESFKALTNVLWNEKVSEFIRWRVVGMLADFPKNIEAVDALIEAYDIDFNTTLQDDILKSLAKLKHKKGLLFIVNKLDEKEPSETKESALDALESITTSRFGFDKNAWIMWVNSNFS